MGWLASGAGYNHVAAPLERPTSVTPLILTASALGLRDVKMRATWRLWQLNSEATSTWRPRFEVAHSCEKFASSGSRAQQGFHHWGFGPSCDHLSSLANYHLRRSDNLEALLLHNRFNRAIFYAQQPSQHPPPPSRCRTASFQRRLDSFATSQHFQLTSSARRRLPSHAHFFNSPSTSFSYSSTTISPQQAGWHFPTPAGTSVSWPLTIGHRTLEDSTT